MSRFAGYIFLSLCFILIAACTSAPKKPSALPAAQVSKLHRMQLAPRLPVPVKSMERQQLSDTWECHVVKDALMKVLILCLHAVQKFIVPQRG